MKGKIFNAQEVQAINNYKKIIILNGDEIRAILDGSKSQIRTIKTSESPEFNIGDNVLVAKKREEVFQVIPKDLVPTTTLLIKEIKVERLASISEEDAIKEGIESFMQFGNSAFKDYSGKHHAIFEAKKSFATLWNATHKKPSDKWEANPWVWCVSFEVINN